jgi:hypothetical protein
MTLFQPNPGLSDPDDLPPAGPPPLLPDSPPPVTPAPSSPPAASAPVLPTLDVTNMGLGKGSPSTPALGTDVDSTGKPVDPVLGELVGIEKSRMSAADRASDIYRTGLAQDVYRSHKAWDAEHATGEDIPKWDEEAQRAKFKTNPVQAFGSLASVFAIIASAFTRRPMINALQGSAAALEAVREGDKEKFDHAYQAWKDNTELVFKRHALEHQEFQDANALIDTDLAAWTTAQKDIARKYGDQQGLVLLENGMNKEYLDRQEQKHKGILMAQEVADATTQWTYRQQVFQQTLKAIDDNAKAAGLQPDDPKVLANKLVAATRILGDEGKKTPINMLMTDFLMRNPQATDDEIVAQWQKLNPSRSRTPEEEIAVEQRAKELMATGLSEGQARMQAESEWSTSKGAGALQRSREQIASREQIDAAKREETNRHNQAMENINADRTATGASREQEIERHNKVVEALNAGKLEEAKRAAQVREAGTGGVQTKDRQILRDANNQVAQEIANGKLDPGDATAVADRRAEILGELTDKAARSRSLTATQENTVTMAPTTLKNLTKILGLVDQSGNLFTHVPERIIGEFGGEGDGVNAYNITRNQINADLLQMYKGGIVSSKSLSAIQDLLPPGTAALNFKTAAFKTELDNLRVEVQDKVNQMEAEHKPIDPNIWRSLREFGIVPSKERASPGSTDSLLVRFHDNPDSLSNGDLKNLIRQPNLSTDDLKKIREYISKKLAPVQNR